MRNLVIATVTALALPLAASAQAPIQPVYYEQTCSYNYYGQYVCQNIWVPDNPYRHYRHYSHHEEHEHDRHYDR